MKRPVVYFALGDNSPTTLFQSKVGGEPYLPIGAEYPKNRVTGNPLILLAQINFAEMPPMPDFPTKGILQFFIDIDDEKYGAGSDEDIPFDTYNNYTREELYEKVLTKRIGYDVIYHAEILPENQLVTDFSSYPVLKHDKESNYWLLGGEFPIMFEEVTEEEISDEHHRKIQHKINGNATFIQGDTCYWVLTEDWHKEHVLLFQLDSEGYTDRRGHKISWGDWGIANFLIKPENLKNLDFSQVVYSWAGT